MCLGRIYKKSIRPIKRAMGTSRNGRVMAYLKKCLWCSLVNSKSDALHTVLRGQGIKILVLHKKNRKCRATQDDRRLSRHKLRFQVERFFSWIDNFQCLVVRWEDHAKTNYLGFVHLAGFLRMLMKIFMTL